MKKSSILIVILWVFFLVSEGQNVMAEPRLEIVEGPSWDFGEVAANQTLTHTFVLKNTGDSVLHIQQAQGG